MGIQRFEDIIAWQKSQEWTVEIYKLFDHIKDFHFKNQICGAAVSISNNIAEGFDRSSKPEFIRFLYYSIASCSEVKSMLYLAEKLNYINKEHLTLNIEQGNEISRILRGLIKSLK
jgi:four helix bundle protein